jgi:hypothetical protein
MKWKTWFKVVNDPKWYTNAMEYDTEDEAQVAAQRKFDVWYAAEEFMVRKEGVDPNVNPLTDAVPHHER